MEIINKGDNNKNKAQYGDMIVIYESPDSLKYFTLEPGKTFGNKYGTFKHDDIFNKEYGTKIFNNNKNGHVTILSFVPCIWERSINKMTQILFNPDISIIMSLLNITQSSIIYESGTGSGCLSTNISSMFTSGHLYTFEFNLERAEKLKKVFSMLKLDNNVTVTHRDVVENGFDLTREELKEESHALADGIFIDLPSPWLIVQKTKRVLKNGASFVSFSPCIEQIHETAKGMKENGFINLRMFECLYRTYAYARTCKVEVPDFSTKRKYGDEIKCVIQDINVIKNKVDMRGHTGFLLTGINISH